MLRPIRWLLLLLAIFIPALAATGYFALQLRRADPSPPANFLAADKGYGVTIDLTRYGDAALAETIISLRANELRWLRQPVNWAELEPEPGRFDWAALDRVLAAVGDDFKLIAVLHTTPAWARPAGTTPASPPANLSDFGNFARAFAARYGQQVDFYQVWHQPNLSADWGDAFVDPAAYADLLREGALNIRAADPGSYILTAALAATLEPGPLNLSELDFLDRLYQANAARWFDVVAIQPYGLWTKPLDAPASDTLNFRRAELVRQVMLRHGDAETPVWATAFGWVVLPATWTGRPSPWSSDTAAVQTPRTAAAIDHARREWPWLGPMLAARWDSADLAADDPARGFALSETPSILEVIRAAAGQVELATVGRYPADHPSGRYSPGWRFAAATADIPAEPPRTLTVAFEGTRLDLAVNRGLFRGHLWVTIDGQPANALPRDGQGRSYVVLYDPLREPATVTLARHLPPGRHQAVIEAEGGWEQWAIAGWTVAAEADSRAAQRGLALAGLLAALTGAGLLWQLVRPSPHLLRPLLTGSNWLITRYAAIGERPQIIITFALAAALYLAPPAFALLLLPLLALAILLRPDLGLAVTTLALFFYHTPLRLPIGSFSPVELALALTLAATLLRGLLTVAASHFRAFAPLPPRSTDLAALALLALALFSALTAENTAVSLREWRTVIAESVLFYFLVRYIPTNNPSRLLDAFVAGAALQALLALYLYFFTDRSIDAEGVHRALGLGYGSPNNLALILGRAWPLLLAGAALPGLSRGRRGAYGAGLLVVGAALGLTFSKGALLLGLPAGIAVMALLYGLRRQNWPKVLAIAAGALLALGLALIPLSQTTRLRTALDFSEGSTGFFRLKLWQSSWAMLRDHWPLGVGPDNFLYQYRTRYILPEAWQEPNLNHPHNFLLDFGTRLGVGGIALLVWLQVDFWRAGWRLYRRAGDPLLLGLLGGMAVTLGHGLVDNSFFLVDLAFAFFLAVGLVQRLAAETEAA